MITQVIYLFIMALILAVIEIQIEGKNGWASKLPTWRPMVDGKLDKIFRKIVSGKPTTGYHLAVFSFVLLFIHYPFFAGLSWDWKVELHTLSLFILFSAVWDFLWIVLNPHYGIKKISVEHIWWHSKRLWGVPVDYFLSLIFSFILYLPLIFLSTNYFTDWLTIVGVFAGLTFLAVIITPEERERWKID